MPLMRLCPSCGVIQQRTGRCARCEAARGAKKVISGRTSVRWKKLRLAVIARDGNTCQRCGRQAPAHLLTVHLAPELRNNHRLATFETCVTLCRSCHGSVDAPRARKSSF
jgi:5-methylcytosine-specific restriction endonuclease McrA